MATNQDLTDDLSVGMTEVRKTLRHYNLSEWMEYLLIRQREKPGSYIVLAHPRDASDFQQRLIQFHKDEAAEEAHPVLETSTGDNAILEVLSDVLQIELGKFMCEALYLCDTEKLYQRWLTQLSGDGRQMVKRIHKRLTYLIRRDAEFS